ncbi:hypothetical protein GGQ60_000238 [Pedobacter zeae]|uniref:Uncharacterized protein n=1 Tax=Pedobacter zeae TaxID=1737356 RepID=A0A7W6K6T4_9SPHI|nr:hypothetical protein [Pedobacter zeae]
MKRYLIILLLCNLVTGKLLFAQNLGDNQGGITYGLLLELVLPIMIL